MSRQYPPGQRPRSAPPAPARRPAARPPVRRAPPRSSRDQLPLIVGGVVAALLVVLIIVVLITNNNSPGPAAVPTAAAGNPAPTAQVIQVTIPAGATAPAAGAAPPRMSLQTFKALYDDPAKRPLIIDVRDVNTYAAGHIVGAISFPEADVDSRFKELPKDKLIIAYCQ